MEVTTYTCAVLGCDQPAFYGPPHRCVRHRDVPDAGDEHCGACGQTHDDGDCDLDPTNVQLAEAVARWERTGILTAGVLRALVAQWNVPDDTPVVLDDGDGWWLNVRHMEAPQTDDSYSCLTLFRGEAWDARSL